MERNGKRLADAIRTAWSQGDFGLMTFNEWANALRTRFAQVWLARGMEMRPVVDASETPVTD
jgi:hypothetical protein